MKRIALGWLGLSAVVLLAGACATQSAAAKSEPAKEEAPAQPVVASAPEAKPVAEAAPVVEAKPADAKPVDAKPAEVKPVDAKPAEAKAEAKKPEAKPAEAKPPEPKPEAKPAEKKGGAYTLVPVAAPDKKLERQWKSKCSSCHGMDGKADTEKGHQMKMEDFTQASWQTAHGNDELKKAIHDGLKRTQNGVKQEMDAFGDELSADQIAQLVQYVRYLGAPK